MTIIGGFVPLIFEGTTTDFGTYCDTDDYVIRAAYADCLSTKMAQAISADLEGDHFDLFTELALARQHMASLCRLLKVAEEANDPKTVIEVQSMITDQSERIAKLAKIVREVENAGQTFTGDRVASLVDKIMGVVTYHVSDKPTRDKITSDVDELCASFKRAAVLGTSVTPDQDAQLMDGTVPSEPGPSGPAGDVA